ncbi:hypothetical protein B0H11DRAFT_1910563 [Mycena galericulata]|nr:hypothetical protein B0H11DRAFT_1910563 [Mycena galericulata]
MPPKKPRAPPAEPLMHGIYCHRYYEKNREEINEKTRDRMRRLRASDVTVPPEVLAARLEARRAAAKRYRQRHQHQLKMKAREARAQAAEERRHAKEKRERRERREAARRRAAECAETASHFCLNRRDSDERYLAQRQGNWDHVGRTNIKLGRGRRDLLHRSAASSSSDVYGGGATSEGRETLGSTTPRHFVIPTRLNQINFFPSTLIVIVSRAMDRSPRNVDLQRGERNINVDYLIDPASRVTVPAEFAISYDVSSHYRPRPDPLRPWINLLNEYIRELVAQDERELRAQDERLVHQDHLTILSSTTFCQFIRWWLAEEPAHGRRGNSRLPRVERLWVCMFMRALWLGFWRRYFPRRVNPITHFQSCTSRLYAPEITYRRDLGEVWTVENGKFDGIHIDWQAKEEAIEGYPGAHAALHKSVELALQHLAARCEAGHHLTCQLRVKEEMCPSTVADDLGDLHCVDGDVDAYYALRAMKGGDGLYMVYAVSDNGRIMQDSARGGRIATALTIGQAFDIFFTWGNVPVEAAKFVTATGKITSKEEAEEFQRLNGGDIFICATQGDAECTSLLCQDELDSLALFEKRQRA